MTNYISAPTPDVCECSECGGVFYIRECSIKEAYLPHSEVYIETPVCGVCGTEIITFGYSRVKAEEWWKYMEEI